MLIVHRLLTLEKKRKYSYTSPYFGETNHYRALVLYDAAAAALAATTASGHPVLVVGGQQLAFLVTTPRGRAVLALPSMNVPFVRGPIQLYQLDHATYDYRNSHQSALVGGDTLGRAEA